MFKRAFGFLSTFAVMGGKKRSGQQQQPRNEALVEAVQALDGGYAAVIDILYHQDRTINQLRMELQQKSSEETLPEGAEKKSVEIKEKASEEPEKKVLVMPESTSGEPSSGVKGPEKSLEGATVELKPSPTQESAEVEMVGGPKTFEPKAKGRPAPSEGASEWEDSEPPWKKPRGDQSEQWLCFRCLKVCGDKSKHCRVAVNALTDAALLSNWVRVALKSRPDSRGEFAELSREMAARRLKQPGSREMGEHAIRELRRAENLGVAPPTELFEKQPTIEEVREAPPLDPTISGTPPVASGLSQPSTPVGESDEEFGSRVKNLVSVLEVSGLDPENKARILGALRRQ